MDELNAAFAIVISTFCLWFIGIRWQIEWIAWIPITAVVLFVAILKSLDAWELARDFYNRRLRRQKQMTIPFDRSDG